MQLRPTRIRVRLNYTMTSLQDQEFLELQETMERMRAVGLQTGGGDMAVPVFINRVPCGR